MISEFITLLTGLNLFLVIALLAWSHSDIKKQFTSIKKSTWILLLIIFLFGTSLRLITPHHHMMFVDEYYNMEAAKNILLNGRAELCEYPDYEQIRCGPHLKLTGPPLMFSLSFLLFGINSYHAIYLCTVLGSISIILMFLLAYLLFNREDVALYSSLLLATYPAYIMWSGSASTNVPGIFFFLLTLFSFFLFFRTGKDRLYLLAVLTLAFALQTRLEFMLLLLLVPMMHLLFDRDLKKRIKNWRFWKIWTVFILFFISFLVQAANYVPMTANIIANAYPTISIFTWIYITSLLSDAAFLVLILLSALAIVSSRERDERKPALFLLLLFLMFFVLSIPLMSPKLLLAACTGLFILSACGASRFVNVLKRISGKPIACTLVTLLLLSLFFPYVYPYYRNPLTEDYYNDAKILETLLLGKIEEDVPANCYVIARHPFLLPTTGLKIATMDTALKNPDAIENMYKKTGCLMFYEDLSCFFKQSRTREGCMLFYYGYCYQRDPLPECQEIKETYSAEKYREYRLGNFTYSLYTLSASNLKNSP
jgi:hypothetical protein